MPSSKKGCARPDSIRSICVLRATSCWARPTPPQVVRSRHPSGRGTSSACRRPPIVSEISAPSRAASCTSGCRGSVRERDSRVQLVTLGFLYVGVLGALSAACSESTGDGAGKRDGGGTGGVDIGHDGTPL